MCDYEWKFAKMKMAENETHIYEIRWENIT